MVELIMQEKGEGKFNTNRINYEADQYQNNISRYKCIGKIVSNGQTKREEKIVKTKEDQK